MAGRWQPVQRSDRLRAATADDRRSVPRGGVCGLTLALLATSPLVVYTWQVAYVYASGHGAEQGDNDFAWMPLGVWALALVALGVLAFVAVLRGVALSDRRAAGFGLAVATGQVVLTHGATVVVAGEPDVFPGGADVLARVVVGGVASLAPMCLALTGTLRPRWCQRRGLPGASVAARYSVFGTLLAAAGCRIVLPERMFPAAVLPVLVAGAIAGVYGMASARRVEASIGLVLSVVPLVLLWGSLPSDAFGAGSADPGVSSVAFGVVQGRTVLASGGTDGTVRVWDPATGQQLGEPLTGHRQGVESVAFGVLEGRVVLASGGRDKTVRLWDPATGQQLGEPLTGHRERVESVAFGEVQGSTVLASGGWDGVRLWDPASGERIGRRWAGHPEGVESVAFGDVEGRQVLATGGYDWILLREPVSGKRIGRRFARSEGVESVAFGMAQGRSVLACAGWHGVQVWDPATPILMRELQPVGPSDPSATSVAFGVVQGRTVLASGSWDGTVRLWDPATGEQIHRLTGQSWSLL